MAIEPEWLAPHTLDEALALRCERGSDATVVAGGTFVGVLMNQGVLAPTALLSLRGVPDLAGISAPEGAGLRLGAMTTHRAVERSLAVRDGWPALAFTFSVVANSRVRNQATVGGVLADADYASDPPAMLTALDARVIARGPGGERSIRVEDLITGFYSTALHPDELLLEVQVDREIAGAVYRKFRSRSNEDRPCVSVAVALVTAPGEGIASRGVNGATRLRVAVGAVADRPQYFPDICGLAANMASPARTSAGDRAVGELAAEIGAQYAARIEPISDVRGSAEYRRRVVAVEVRRALVDLYLGHNNMPANDGETRSLA